jgi:hypothetical protein
MRTEQFFMSAAEDHDIIFFFGDLNYRIMEGVELEEVYELLNRTPGVAMDERNEILLAMDQLFLEKEAGSFPFLSVLFPPLLSCSGLLGLLLRFS